MRNRAGRYLPFDGGGQVGRGEELDHEPTRLLVGDPGILRVAAPIRRVLVRVGEGAGALGRAVLAGAPARPLLVTTAGRSPVDEDLRWARLVAEHPPDAAHRVVDLAEAPEFFADLDAPPRGMDELAPFAVGAARARYTARLLAESGMALHFNGQGGDEVLLAPLACLRAAIRTDPRTGWRHLRGPAALQNTPLWTMTLAVLRNDSLAVVVVHGHGAEGSG